MSCRRSCAGRDPGVIRFSHLINELHYYFSMLWIKMGWDGGVWKQKRLTSVELDGLVMM